MDRIGAFATRAVLVAVAPRRAIAFARAFCEAGFMPTLAFDADQVFEFGAQAEVIVTDDRIDRDARALRRAGDAERTVRVFIADTSRCMPAQVHALVAADIDSHELVARVRTLLALRGEWFRHDQVEWGPLVLDVARRDARLHGHLLGLTATQFRLVAALVRSQGAVLTKEELQREVWPDAPPDNGERLVAHIRRIRAKLERDSSHPQLLVTARGKGFRLVDPANDDLPVMAADADWDGLERRRIDRRREALTAYRTHTA